MINLSRPAAAAAKLPQSCPTLCDPIDGSPPGSADPGILQARTGAGCHCLLLSLYKSILKNKVAALLTMAKTWK